MYRIKSTGEIKSQGEVRKMFPNVSFPKIWDDGVCNQFGIDPIFESPTPTTTRYQLANKNGVEFKNGKWMWAWTIGPTFTSNEEATAAEQEAAYIQRIDNEQADRVRADRDKKLLATDWRFRSDMNPSQAWIDYCQALRDIPTQEGFPWDITWPEEPQ